MEFHEQVGKVTISVNGQLYDFLGEDRLTLADWLRDQCDLTGTHLGCEQGVCGACTVLFDGEAVRSCLMFARQAIDSQVVTIEGVAQGGSLHPIQQAFHEEHGLQCGFCTPGFVISVYAYLNENPNCEFDELVGALGGNLCRCTGYQGIVAAVSRLVDRSS